MLVEHVVAATTAIASVWADEAPRVTRYDPLVERLREAARPDREAPPEFAVYLDKVRRHAYRVTDEDVEALKHAGYSEDEIFEQTVSAAVAAGLDRLEAGLRVLP
jgi:alkylhydroperoxidase family enzyme